MFKPKNVIFEEEALSYDLGNSLYKDFLNKGVNVIKNKRGSFIINSKNEEEFFIEGKNTLVVGTYKGRSFESCKPSANYQLPLVSGCMGMCEYCYLNTRLSKKPYTKIYVNTYDILNKASAYAEERKEITIFEGAATSDPVPVEPYTKALRNTIEYVGKKENMLFRFVTKFTDIDELLEIEHNGKTTIRFSINTESVISNFEHRVASLKSRLEAAKKVKKAGYKLGFIIAPVFIYEGFEDDYYNLLENVSAYFKDENIEFEIITHRFTETAKKSILLVFPNTSVPMDKEGRTYKYGQFGYGKYVYEKESLESIKIMFEASIHKLFSNALIKYII